MLNVELTLKWIAALRSGKYQQGRGYLRTQGSDGVCYDCCLGVLCDVVDPTKWDKVGSWSLSVPYEVNDYDLTYSISEHLGISSVSGWLEAWFVEKYKLPYNTLTNLNDNAEYTFNQIADLLQTALYEQELNDKEVFT